MTSPDAAPERPVVSPLVLFMSFARMTLSGFGGVMIFAHRMIVEERRWLTEQEFAELLGMCQVLPGANVLNVAVCLGDRLNGPLGAFAAACGLMMPPFLVMIAAGALYDRFGDVTMLQGALAGISAVAPGLLAALGVRIVIQYRRNAIAIAFIAAAFLGLGILRLPLLLVLAVAAPLAILAERTARR